jgi:hypothetical protein
MDLRNIRHAEDVEIHPPFHENERASQGKTVIIVLVESFIVLVVQKRPGIHSRGIQPNTVYRDTEIRLNYPYHGRY